MKIKLKGTKPSKINIKGILHLYCVLKGHFQENQALRDQTFKNNVKGTLNLKLVLKGHFHENQA